MAYTESNMLPLGTTAPEFSLLDPSTGRSVHLADIAAGRKATVIMFLCNHCPYVLYINPQIVQIVEAYEPLGVAFVGINSNDADAYPDDSPERMPAHAQEVGYTFPYLFDATQEVARQYDAACTPDFYVFDHELRLAYRGQLDASRPKRNPVESDGADLRAALDAVLKGDAVPAPQRPSGGCNIKWKVMGE
ncbi:MAG: thioredoxin family protein [Saprospiraceae bacterium]|nr:thioredoxin family protein [Saprospiraceae bacterium]